MRLRALSSLLLAACTSGGDGSTPDAAPTADAAACSGFVGDRALPVEVEAIAAEAASATGESYRPIDLTEGTRVPLIASPTGAVMMLLSARAKNLDTCAVEVTAVLRDTAVKATTPFTRTLDLLAGSDGWAATARPDLAAGYVIMFACPNTWSDRTVYEQPYDLEVSVKDRDGRTAQTSLSIVPFCSEPAHMEQCLDACQPTP